MDKSCRHLWDIEPPRGPTSKGTCHRCGATQTFFNNLMDCASVTDVYKAGYGGPYSYPTALHILGVRHQSQMVNPVGSWQD